MSRRMFSSDIIESEEFISMPVSSQALYFHLAINADDDGFIQPKLTMRKIGSNEDDIKVLIAKRFVLAFEEGVVVIKHWLIHNKIRPDRYKPTRFQTQKDQLAVRKDKAYTEMSTICQPNDNQMSAQVRLGQVRLGKIGDLPVAGEEVHSKSWDEFITRRQKGRKAVRTHLNAEPVLKAFEEIDPKNKRYNHNQTQLDACEFLVQEYGLDVVLGLIPKLKETNKKSYYQITTPLEMVEKITKVFNDLTRKGSEVKSKGRGLA